MAGSFGFDEEKYGVSEAIGELSFARGPPGPADSLIIADGFSCREQIANRPIATPCTWPR